MKCPYCQSDRVSAGRDTIDDYYCRDCRRYFGPYRDMDEQPGP